MGIVNIIGRGPGHTDFYQHGSAESCIKSLKSIDKSFYDYYSYCLVRNPWDRYLSFFKYYKQGYELSLQSETGHTPAKIKELALCKKIFEENKTEQEILKILILKHKSQDTYFTNQDKKILVSYVGRFENIAKEFALFCEKIKIYPTPELKHENRTEEINYRDFYNQELIDIVAEKEKFIIEKYSYAY
jgi:hypothetical protein